MSVTELRRKKHDRLLDELEHRIRAQYPEDIIHRNYEYNVGDVYGEVDLLRIRGNVHYFYEVKEGLRIVKARKQYERYRDTFPQFDVKGIFVSNYGICRRL